MKKMMILAVVLGMASLAVAGPILDVTGSTVSVNSDTDPYNGIVAWTSTLTGVSSLTAIGDLPNSSLTQYPAMPATDIYGPSSAASGLGQIIVAAFAIGADTNTTQAAGNHLDVLFTLAEGQFFGLDSAQGLGAVYLTTQNGSAILDTIYVNAAPAVPEPMTMALLGLGGLFLRRRK